jgi:hypothetical protein
LKAISTATFEALSSSASWDESCSSSSILANLTLILHRANFYILTPVWLGTHLHAIPSHYEANDTAVHILKATQDAVHLTDFV